MVWALAHLATVPRMLVVVSLAFPIYYVGLSLALHTRRTQVYRWLHRLGIQVEMFRRRVDS